MLHLRRTLATLVVILIASLAASAATGLHQYTAPDGSVTVSIPDGWKVSKAAQTAVNVDGPNGEWATIGNTFVAVNAPYQPGKSRLPGVDLSMPYSLPLGQKFLTIFKWASAMNGHDDLQMSFTSAMAIPVGKVLGQCGRATGTISGGGYTGSLVFEAVMCSLPADFSGTYKNIFLVAALPKSLAASERATAEAMLKSYRPSVAMLQRKLAPVHAAPRMPAGAMPVGGSVGAINSVTRNMIIGADHSAECMDLGVLRETPERLLPSYCR